MQVRLPTCPSSAARRDVAEACFDCRNTRTCAVCGKQFISASTRACCSDECAVLHRRARDLEQYYSRTARDPDYNKRRHEANKARAAQDPAFAARLAAIDRAGKERRREKLRSDPELRERVNERARQQHREQAERRNARRHELLAQKLSLMSDAELQAWRERRRESWRRTAARKVSTPEGRERYREYMRAYERERALRRLATIGDQLMQRHTDEDDDEQ